MSKTNWIWGDFKPKKRKRSSVETVTITATRSVTEQNRKDDFFAKLKATSDLYRQRKRVSSQPIEWSFKDINISVSSDESNGSDQTTNRTPVVQQMTSTPQIKSISKATQKSTSKALKPWNHRKSFVPQNMERTVLDCSPYASPFTPKTVVKRKRNDRTTNTFIFDKSMNKSMNRSFKSTTTQTNDSLRTNITAFDDQENQFEEQTVAQELSFAAERDQPIESQEKDLSSQEAELSIHLEQPLPIEEVEESEEEEQSEDEEFADEEESDEEDEAEEEDLPEEEEEEQEEIVVGQVDVEIRQEEQVDGGDVHEESDSESDSNPVDASYQSNIDKTSAQSSSTSSATVGSDAGMTSLDNFSNANDEESQTAATEPHTEEQTVAQELSFAAERDQPIEYQEKDLSSQEDELSIHLEQPLPIEEVEESEESQTAATEPHTEELELQEEEQQEEEQQEEIVVGQVDVDDEIRQEEQVDGGDVHEESDSDSVSDPVDPSYQSNIGNTSAQRSSTSSSTSSASARSDVGMTSLANCSNTNESQSKAEESQTAATEPHTEELDLQEEEQQEDEEQVGLRRSKRKRMPVMEYWRGQRPIYKRDSTGICEKVVAIADGSIDQPKQRKKRKIKRLKADSDHKSHSQTNIFDLSLHKKVKISDNTINKESLKIKSMESLNWKKSSQSVGVDIAIINKNKTKGDAIGMLRMKGFGEKKRSKTGGYATHLTVTFGALTLKIEDSDDVIVRTGDSFTVNPNTNYSLVNLRKDVAYISFTVLKE